VGGVIRLQRALHPDRKQGVVGERVAVAVGGSGERVTVGGESREQRFAQSRLGVLVAAEVA